MRKKLNNLTAINLLFLIMLYVIETFIAERYWLTTLISYTPQIVFIVPAISLMVWGLLKKRKTLLLINGGALILTVFILMGFNVPTRSLLSTSSGETVRIMSYNIRHGDAGAKAIWQIISKNKPDIVCLQEVFSKDKNNDPAKQIIDQMPKGWYVAQSGELMTLSRFKCAAFPKASTTRTTALLSRIQIRGKSLNFINTHLASITPMELLSNMANLDYVQQKTDARTHQMELLLKAPSSTVVAGDFNTPPHGLLYNRISSQMNDSFKMAGWGFGYTFRSNAPLLRIDYIFTNPGSTVKRCYVVNTNVSNHKPIIADIILL